MYNVHQYNLSVRAQERLKFQEQQYAKYLLRHEGKTPITQTTKNKLLIKHRPKPMLSSEK